MSPRNHADCDAVLNGHFRSLLAQFGLTPKSQRGLADWQYWFWRVAGQMLLLKRI